MSGIQYTGRKVSGKFAKVAGEAVRDKGFFKLLKDIRAAARAESHDTVTWLKDKKPKTIFGQFMEALRLWWKGRKPP